MRCADSRASRIPDRPPSDHRAFGPNTRMDIKHSKRPRPRHAFISRGLFRRLVAAPMRVGVIGVGSMGQNHARVYSEIADLVGIADPDVKAGGPASNRFNVSYYRDSAHLLKEELARDIGVVMDLGVHEIDIVRYLVGAPVESVFALGGRKIHAAFEDHANILLRFQNGVHGFVEVNWLTPMKVRQLALTCLKNFVEVDYTEQSVTVSSSTLGPLDPFNLYQIPLEHHTQKIHVRKEEPLRRELEDFLDAVKHKRPPLVTGEDAAETLWVAIAATDSHRTGKLVQLL